MEPATRAPTSCASNTTAKGVVPSNAGTEPATRAVLVTAQGDVTSAAGMEPAMRDSIRGAGTEIEISGAGMETAKGNAISDAETEPATRAVTSSTGTATAKGDVKGAGKPATRTSISSAGNTTATRDGASGTGTKPVARDSNHSTSGAGMATRNGDVTSDATRSDESVPARSVPTCPAKVRSVLTESMINGPATAESGPAGPTSVRPGPDLLPEPADPEPTRPATAESHNPNRLCCGSSQNTHTQTAQHESAVIPHPPRPAPKYVRVRTELSRAKQCRFPTGTGSTLSILILFQLVQNSSGCLFPTYF